MIAEHCVWEGGTNHSWGEQLMYYVAVRFDHAVNSIIVPIVQTVKNATKAAFSCQIRIHPPTHAPKVDLLLDMTCEGNGLIYGMDAIQLLYRRTRQDCCVGARRVILWSDWHNLSLWELSTAFAT